MPELEQLLLHTEQHKTQTWSFEFYIGNLALALNMKTEGSRRFVDRRTARQLAVVRGPVDHHGQYFANEAEKNQYHEVFEIAVVNAQRIQWLLAGNNSTHTRLRIGDRTVVCRREIIPEFSIKISSRNDTWYFHRCT